MRTPSPAGLDSSAGLVSSFLTADDVALEVNEAAGAAAGVDVADDAAGCSLIFGPDDSN